MWMIRNKTLAKISGKRASKEKQWWSESVGWTWQDHADMFTTEQKANVLVPRGGVWEEVSGV